MATCVYPRPIVRRPVAVPKNFAILPRMKLAAYIIRCVLAYLVLSVATFLMLEMIIDYASFRTDIHFLRYKQDYIHIPIWKVAFYTHVFSSILALAAGFTQFSDFFSENLPAMAPPDWAYLCIRYPDSEFSGWHDHGPLRQRWLAFQNRLRPTRLSLVLVYLESRGSRTATPLSGTQTVYDPELCPHFSAITLRSWKIVLFNTFHPDPVHLYMIDAWMGFVPNLLPRRMGLSGESPGYRSNHKLFRTMYPTIASMPKKLPMNVSTRTATAAVEPLFFTCR